MFLFDTSPSQADTRPDYRSHEEELNRLLSAAVVSTRFRNLLLANPEIALASGYQGETFHLSNEDRNWLLSLRPASLVDLAANLVVYRQESRQDTKVAMPVEAPRQYVANVVNFKN